MAKLTSKGRGRPRKVVDNANHDGKNTSNDATSNGNGQTSAAGIGLPTQPTREKSGVSRSLVELTNIIIEHNLKHRQDVIVRAWHPSIDKEKTIDTNASDVQLLVGESAYQLSTGKVIKV